jgi:hypothetical protein
MTPTPTPRTDANESITCKEGDPCIAPDFARTLERDIAELNERLIDRQQTLMAQAVKLQAASHLLTRCRDSAGRMEMGLYEDIQNFLHTQP